MPITASTSTTATVQQPIQADAFWAGRIAIDTVFGASTSGVKVTAIPYIQATGQQGAFFPLATIDTAKAAANIGADFATALGGAWANIEALLQLWADYNVARQADVATAKTAVAAAQTSAATAHTAHEVALVALGAARKAMVGVAPTTALQAAVAAALVPAKATLASLQAAQQAIVAAQATLAKANAALADPANPPI
ncbi:MAG TPA: hypothetical protein VHY37_07220 [Tepidisphaeraceae bacterium]|jgi:hypothetical protein|nr:hypothetical protein [Tepidisphaeraceae bacterium]